MINGYECFEGCIFFKDWDNNVNPFHVSSHNNNLPISFRYILLICKSQVWREKEVFSYLNFWDKPWLFLSLRVFGLLSSCLLLFPQHFGQHVLRPSSGACCLNFWDEAWWFLSLMVFRLLSSSLLLFPQRFGQHVLRPSSVVYLTSNYVLYWIQGGHLFWFR